MPDFASTLLLAFILASCFTQKHIRDWHWFKYGLYAYALSVGIVLVAAFIDALVWTSPWILTAGGRLVSTAAVVAAGVAFVVACLRHARQDVEHLRCLNCGYILKGLSEPRCPECGRQI